MRSIGILTLFLIILPAAVPAYTDITQYVETGNGKIYGISRENGFIVSDDNGKSWKKKNNGLPQQIAYPFDQTNPIPFTSVSIDPANPERIVLTSYWGLFVTENGGDSWEEIPLGEPIRPSAYMTSAAASPYDGDTFLLGTSFSGLYITRDGGQSWEEFENLTKPLYKGAGFLEEITSVVYNPFVPGEIYIAAGFGNGLYRADLETETMELLEMPEEEGEVYIHKLDGMVRQNDRFELTVYSSKGSYIYQPSTGRWRNTRPKEIYRPPLGSEKLARLRLASEKYGIYLKSWNAGGEDLEKYITFLKEHGMNSIVVDVKDDLGRVTYNTALETPRAAGAVREHMDIKKLLAAAQEEGIYVIGRIVTFQDPKLYRYDNGRYAVWNYQKEEPWGHKFKVEDEETEEVSWVQREFWVDPFSEFAWEYNISIAEELQNLGIDEIQFDYIRFPSDGDMTGIHYRYRKEGMRKIDAIESFLRIARERLSIPISTDLYGFNSWYRMGNWIGQNIEMVSHYVDAISPMYYPSHFPRDFLKDLSYFERAERIYREGTRRSIYICEGRSVIRPYVQAFLLGGELEFEEPEYTDYLDRQLRGAKSGLASGFTLWNNSNRYYMVTTSLKPYTGNDDENDSTALMD